MVIQIRFDPVYVGHFKCNIRTIRGGYPNIHLQVPFCFRALSRSFAITVFSWMRRLYWQNDAFQSTTNFDHIKSHYYWSHAHVCFEFSLRAQTQETDVMPQIQINPTRIVPIGPIPPIEPLET